MYKTPDEHPTGHVRISEARDAFAALVNRAAFGGERVLLSRRGRPIAAIVPIDDVALLEDAERLGEPAVATGRRRGALALVGSWSSVEDEVLDGILAEIYEARDRDRGRRVDLP